MRLLSVFLILLLSSHAWAGMSLHIDNIDSSSIKFSKFGANWSSYQRIRFEFRDQLRSRFTISCGYNDLAIIYNLNLGSVKVYVENCAAKLEDLENRIEQKQKPISLNLNINHDGSGMSGDFNFVYAK